MHLLYILKRLEHLSPDNDTFSVDLVAVAWSNGPPASVEVTASCAGHVSAVGLMSNGPPRFGRLPLTAHVGPTVCHTV